MIATARDAGARDETEDPRLSMLDALLGSPHGDLRRLGEIHRQADRADPEFYTHLAVWYQAHGVIRDQQQAFISQLSLGGRAQRETAYVLLQQLRTYQLARVVRYLKEKRRLPRRTRSAVVYWLRRRERDPAWFDEVALRDRRNLKYLYATLHLRPSRRAAAILFSRDPPADSRLAAIKQLARERDPRRIAAGVVEHRIFSATAVGFLPRLDPPALAALIEVMTPQQLLNGLAALERRGALAHPRLRPLVERKLRAARDEGRVQDMRMLRAAAACRDQQLRGTIGRIAADRLRQRGRIKRATAIFVDKSASMEEAIDLARHVATLCSTLADASLELYAFDAIGRKIAAPAHRDLAGWSAALAHVHANGSTSIGAPFDCLMREGSRVEQVVVITDGDENTAPLFTDALDRYERWAGLRCQVVIVLVGCERRRTVLDRRLQDAGRVASRYVFDGDLYSLPNLVPYLTTPQRAELCAEILATEVPTLADLQRLPPGFDPETCELL